MESKRLRACDAPAGLRGAGASLLRPLIVCAAVLALAAAASANPGLTEDDGTDGLPSLEALLARYVEAVGGEEAILRLSTRVAEMRIVTDLDWDPPIYEVDSLSIYGTSEGEFLVVTRTPEGVMLEGCDGDEAWKIDLDGRVVGVQAGRPRDRWMSDPRYPLKLREYFPDMRLVGLDVWDGQWVYVVDVDGREDHRFAFDVNTGLLTRMGYHQELRDYEEIDGVLFPRRVVYGRKGGSSTFVLDAVRHNVYIDRTVFSLAK